MYSRILLWSSVLYNVIIQAVFGQLLRRYLPSQSPCLRVRVVSKFFVRRGGGQINNRFTKNSRYGFYYERRSLKNSTKAVMKMKQKKVSEKVRVV